MFPEPPDPNKMWIKGFIVLIVFFILYAFMKEGMRMVTERGSMVPSSEFLKKPYSMNEDGQAD